MVEDLDADPREADWIKTLHWDLPDDPRAFTQAELQHLSTLPAWEAAPPQIKDALGDPLQTREGARAKAALAASGKEMHDRHGRPLGVGDDVKWLSLGRWEFGVVTASIGPHQITIRDQRSGEDRDLPTHQVSVLAEGDRLLREIEFRHRSGGTTT